MISKNKKLPNLLQLLITVKWRFCKSFLFKKAYKEGALGILIAMLCAGYPLISYLKVIEKKHENC
jgi:hypothetical protein